MLSPLKSSFILKARAAYATDLFKGVLFAANCTRTYAASKRKAFLRFQRSYDE